MKNPMKNSFTIFDLELIYPVYLLLSLFSTVFVFYGDIDLLERDHHIIGTKYFGNELWKQTWVMLRVYNLVQLMESEV